MSDSETDIDNDLSLLGKLEVMHVTPFQPAHDESIDRVHGRIKQLEQAISALEAFGDDKQKAIDTNNIVDYSTLKQGEIQLMEKVLETESKRRQLENFSKQQINALEWYKKWGYITQESLEELAQYGVFIKLYEVNDKVLKGIQDRQDIFIIQKINNVSMIALVSENADVQLEFTRIYLPNISNDNLDYRISGTFSEIDTCERILRALRPQKKVLQAALDERNRRFNVRNVQYSGISIDKTVRYWKGFIPEPSANKFMLEAKKHQWGYIIEDPAPDEIGEVPTQIISPRWVERIRPVMNFMGLVPGYKELDVSKVFMLFFTFFTGILVGDAGYGLIFLLLTFLFHRKQKFTKKITFELFYTLSASILFWGILTGTYFGAEFIAQIPFFSKLTINKLASFGGDNIFIQKLMFIIGAVHLTIAHLQLAWRYHNKVKALAQLGWILVVWGLYYVVNKMVLSIPIPEFATWLFIGGALLITLFSNPGSNFFKGVLSSIGNLPLSIINGFSDIISYIRLYAVGLSTVLMASSFNQMALGNGVSTVAAAIVAVLILVLGHGLNMILAAMSVLVHGVRLNMLEYGGHANVEFSGNEYKPFKI